MSVPESWREFREKYQLGNLFPEAELSESLAFQMRRDLDNLGLNANDARIDQRDTVFAHMVSVLNQDNNALLKRMEQALAQAHSPRANMPKPAQNAAPGVAQKDTPLATPTWADFDLAAFNSLENIRDNLADRVATEFDQNAMKDLVEADMTLRLYAAHKAKMAAPKPGSGGGKRLEDEYTYTPPKPRPM